MNTALRPGERVLKEGDANLQRGIETVGGSLCLTDQRLVFEAHRFNVQRGATEVELSSVRATEPCWTKFLGVIPLFPNSLAVFTHEGAEYRFVVFGRGAWAAAIDAQRMR